MKTAQWSLIGPSSRGAIAPGDRVSAAAGGLPIYEVLDVVEGRLRLRDEQGRNEQIVQACDLRWKLCGGGGGGSSH